MKTSIRHDFTEEEVLALAKRAYEEGEAHFEIDPDRCALIVIDLQDEFVRPHWTPFWVPEATRQIPRVKHLIEVCRDRRVPVIYTVFSDTHRFLDRPRSGADMPNRHPELSVNPEWFRAGSIWDELDVGANDIVIHKPSYGAFHDTALETILRNLGRDTVIICGTLTNLCCGTTAREAYARGFNVVVGSDVTATNIAEIHEAELKTLRYGFARVMTSAGIIASVAKPGH